MKIQIDAIKHYVEMLQETPEPNMPRINEIANNIIKELKPFVEGSTEILKVSDQARIATKAALVPLKEMLTHLQQICYALESGFNYDEYKKIAEECSSARLIYQLAQRLQESSK